MNARTHSELRKLSLAYYRGWIPRDQYLQIRHDYLQSVTNGETPAAIDPKKIAPPPSSRPKAPPSTTDDATKTKLLVGIFVLLVSITLIILIINRFSPPATTSPTTVAPSATKEDVAVETTPEKPLTSEELFEHFISTNFINRHTWEQEQLNSLKLKWLGLSPQQQQAIKSTKTFQDFSGALVERIVDERKLNNIVPSDNEMLLLTIARSLEMLDAIPERE